MAWSPPARQRRSWLVEQAGDYAAPISTTPATAPLLVEDDYLIADDLQNELTKAGAEVIGPVATLAKALQILGAGTALDGAVLDVNLGGEKVFPLVDALRQRGIPSVFVTGHDERAIPAAYADVPHCEKPAGACKVAQALRLG
jgi:DNA-binding LytR/AlgR family response regulator